MANVMYPAWEQKITLKKYSNHQWVVCIHHDSIEPSEYIINDSAAEIISLFDGKTTYNEIIEHLSLKYHEEARDISEKVDSFIMLIGKDYDLHLAYDDQKRECPVTVEKGYPKVCSLEITNMCNIQCLHCYGSYGAPEKHSYFSIEQANLILEQLDEINIEIVELTGGDVTVNPYFAQILVAALNKKFKKVVVLTNGILLNSEIFEIAERYKDKIIFQIDLHSLNDDYLAWFTGRKNTLNKIMNNICALTSRNVKVRVVTMATLRNMSEIPHIADWAYQHGVIQYAVSTVVGLGRAVSNEDALYITDTPDIETFSKLLQAIIEKYPGFMKLNIDGENARNNCGAISSHVVIDSVGNIKLCTMDTLQYFNSSIGNIFNDCLKNIYDQNEDFVFAFANTTAPNMNSDECSGCQNRHFCNGCILRAVIKGSNNPNCKWIASLPAALKNHFKIAK